MCFTASQLKLCKRLIGLHFSLCTSEEVVHVHNQTRYKMLGKSALDTHLHTASPYINQKATVRFGALSPKKTVWRVLKKLKIELPYDPETALLSIYPKDTDVVKYWDTHIPMFTAAMSTIA